MDVKTVLHGIVERIDDDLFKNEDNRVMHKTEEFIDLYRNAHGEFMPDDYMYEHIYHIISEIETYLRYNTDEYDVIDDLIDELTGEIYVEPISILVLYLNGYRQISIDTLLLTIYTNRDISVVHCLICCKKHNQ